MPNTMRASQSFSTALPSRPSDTRFIKAKHQAVALRPPAQSWESDTVRRQIEGRVLVIGDQQSAIGLMGDMPPSLSPHALLTDLDAHLPNNMDHVMTALGGRVIKLEGHWGNFTVTLTAEGETSANTETVEKILQADLILDLQDTPLLQQAVLPPGYFVLDLRTAPHEWQKNLEGLEQWSGEVARPCYVSYHEERCVHGAPQTPPISGCQQCIEVCPTQAIHSIGTQIRVEDDSCQGCGHCASACPSGALRYHYPPPANQLDQLRQMLNHYHAIAGRYPRVLFHQNDTAFNTEHLPVDVLPFAVHSIGSIGPEIFFAALSFGANQILLAQEPETSETLYELLKQHIQTAHELLQGLGYPRRAVRLLEPQSVAYLKVESVMPTIKTTRQIGLEDKRQQWFFALDHLYEQSPNKVSARIPLSQNHGMGVINVDQKACTLCTQCVDVCPVNALQVFQEAELYFYTNRCVQCNLCKESCPEQAISLESTHITNVLERREPKRMAFKPERYT